MLTLALVYGTAVHKTNDVSSAFTLYQISNPLMLYDARSVSGNSCKNEAKLSYELPVHTYLFSDVENVTCGHVT